MIKTTTTKKTKKQNSITYVLVLWYRSRWYWQK